MFHVEQRGGRTMELREFIKKHTDLQFGVCEFSLFQNALIPC